MSRLTDPVVLPAPGRGFLQVSRTRKQLSLRRWLMRKMTVNVKPVVTEEKYLVLHSA
ncbi:hypothetical protein ACIQU6_28580 [Streptomyces sp. NPDC090442]|uniref:hypothetical protein n=1 Tax=Streptomyces sp. NPDC090442 TaxID=3365962 RepID=UPI0037F7A552